jgi:hypothetical protein
MIRKAAAATAFLLGAVIVLLPTAAKAVYIYNYVPIFSDPFRATLTVTDAAVASGNMNFRIGPELCSGATCSNTTGDDSGFISLDIGIGSYDDLFTPTQVRGTVAVGATFNLDGTLSGFVTGLGVNSDFESSGSDFNWDARWASDGGGLLCPDERWDPSFPGCRDPGHWTTARAVDVPQPASIWLFSSGLLTLLLCFAASRKAHPKCAIS